MENNLRQTSRVNARLFSKLFSITCPQSSSSRGGLAVELGPGRFNSEGARTYSSESFTGHSFERNFAGHCLDWLQMIFDSLCTI